MARREPTYNRDKMTIENMTFHISETKKRIAYEKRHLNNLQKYLADVRKR